MRLRRAVVVGLASFIASLASADNNDAAPDALKSCSKCHLAFPAAMLPARSWAAIVGDMQNHFGKNVSLAPEEREAILAYLSAHAADAPAASAEERHFLSGLSGDVTPMRITDCPWWVQMHADIDFRASVRSPSDCQACHADGFEK